MHYWPHQVELRGRLERVTMYGPPNYGENPETDAKYAVPILRLVRPIRMCADSVGDIHHPEKLPHPGRMPALDSIVEVQVNIFPPLTAWPLYGKMIRVGGTLEQAVMAHDFTAVVMDPDSGKVVVEHETPPPSST